MKCPACGNENQPGAKFCVHCGIVLGTASAPAWTATPASSATGSAPRPAAFMGRSYVTPSHGRRASGNRRYLKPPNAAPERQASADESFGVANPPPAPKRPGRGVVWNRWVAGEGAIGGDDRQLKDWIQRGAR